MCGIAGIFNHSQQSSPERDLLEGMVESLAHRGPDDSGLYLEGPVGLGMRRLSIIDVEGGHQPLCNEDQSVWVVFNGEIYNYRELRRELEKAGHVFESASDTEVIVHGYEEWGDSFLLRLNGIFGLALYDQPHRRLLLARDPFGVKPLYYHDDGRRLIFSSEIKAILKDSRITREVDRAALDLYLAFRFVPSPRTMFRGISKLRPGHALVIEDGRTRPWRYWQTIPSIEASLPEAEYVRRLQDGLERAVQRQMMSDVPLGALLSGGIDSSAVVAIMSRAASEPIRTFTVGFKDGKDVNELEEARAFARQVGAEHREIQLDHLDYAQSIENAVWHMDEPIATTSALAMHAVCDLAREEVKVVLTGQGADEPFAGYHRYLGERYGRFYRFLPEFLRTGVLHPAVRALPRLERYKRAAGSLGISDVNARFAAIYALFPPDLKERLCLERGPGGESAADVIGYWRRGIQHLDSLSQMTYVDARLSLADDLLLYGDKMSMAASVEARVPFLDLEFMQLAEALPGHLRVRNLERKYIHKRVVSRWLAPDIIQRPKKGFETPMDRWFQTELTGHVRGQLLGRDSACLRYFHKAVIEEMIRDHASRREDYRRQLFALLTFETWHRIFVS